MCAFPTKNQQISEFGPRVWANIPVWLGIATAQCKIATSFLSLISEPFTLRLEWLMLQATYIKQVFKVSGFGVQDNVTDKHVHSESATPFEDKTLNLEPCIKV